MRDKLIISGIFALGVAILAAGWMNISASVAQTSAPADAPVLEITVTGQAEGVIRIALRPDLAPGHVERVTTLAERGDYDGVIFHRVIDGFMAQTGDVQHGRPGGQRQLAGTGGSDLGNLPAEFSDEPFVAGTMGMARAQHPDSANSQFFLMFAPAPHLNGQYTVLGQVIEGHEVLSDIKRGTGPNGAVMGEPDAMQTVRVVR